MIGYAGDRIPIEYGPALLVVGLALAVLVLLIIPAPAIASALELRLARRLRALRYQGDGARAVRTWPARDRLGARIGARRRRSRSDRTSWAPISTVPCSSSRRSRCSSPSASRRLSGVKASARAALDVVLPGLVLTASVAGIVDSRRRPPPRRDRAVAGRRSLGVGARFASPWPRRSRSPTSAPCS